MSKTFKMRIVSLMLVLIAVFSAMPTTTASAASNYDGGLGFVYQKTNVYKEQSCTTYQGYLYADESFTILNKYSNGVWFIRYSMSSGPKTGYINAAALGDWKYDDSSTTCVAQPKGYTDVYYGNNSTEYVRARYVDQEELVVVLSQYGGWSYIEYDTTAGRKRGYVVSSNDQIINMIRYKYKEKIYDKHKKKAN